MNNHISYQHAAEAQCEKSSYKHKLGAVVIRRGRVVGSGFNKVHSTGIPRLDGKHAEIEALNNTTAQYRKGSTVYVCRVTQGGNNALAKPCETCYTIMKKMGVKRVWYSTNTEWHEIIL